MSIRLRFLMLAVMVTVSALAALMGVAYWPDGSGRGAAALVAGIALIVVVAVDALIFARRIDADLRDTFEQLRLDVTRLGGKADVTPRRYDIEHLDEVGIALADAHVRLQRASAAQAQRVEQSAADARQAHLQLSRRQRLEAMGRLIGGVVHDFNNVLAIINNNAYVLQHMPSLDKREGPIGAIKRAVENGTKLTRQLRAFSRRQSIAPEVIDLRERLPEMLDLVHTSIGNAIDLDVEVAATTQPIEADVAELEVALINLAVNARDAMPEGGELIVQARMATPDEALEPNRPYAVISVTDSGIGIPEGLHERVFEPFFTTKENGRGTGLGLTQVKNFAEQTGGAVRAFNAPEGGTTVRLILPTTTLKTEQPFTSSAPMNAEARRGDRVLLVEDNNELAVATHAVLQAFGYQVLSVHSADEALKLLEQNPKAAEVVVSDVVMAGEGNGFDLACELRERRPDLPVILVTGYVSEMDRARAQGFEVLQKPCPPEVLASAIARARAGRERSLIEALQRGTGVGTDH